MVVGWWVVGGRGTQTISYVRKFSLFDCDNSTIYQLNPAISCK